VSNSLNRVFVKILNIPTAGAQVYLNFGKYGHHEETGMPATPSGIKRESGTKQKNSIPLLLSWMS
jgi:hypothetical protein